MSITLELPELSPELEKQLAALPEEERGRYAAALMEKGLAESATDPDEDDLLMVGPPSTCSPIALSQEAAEKIKAVSEEIPGEPDEWIKQAAENYRRLTGKSLQEGAIRIGNTP